jgi:hypothetical protein
MRLVLPRLKYPLGNRYEFVALDAAIGKVVFFEQFQKIFHFSLVEPFYQPLVLVAAALAGPVAVFQFKNPLGSLHKSISVRKHFCRRPQLL